MTDHAALFVDWASVSSKFSSSYVFLSCSRRDFVKLARRARAGCVLRLSIAAECVRRAARSLD